MTTRSALARATATLFLLASVSLPVDAKKNCAQGNNLQDGECLTYLGRARVEDAGGSTVAQRSFWLSSNIFDNDNTFYLQASGWQSSLFDLPPGGLRISLSPVVSEGGGGTHRLYLTPGSPDCGRNNGCNIDSQNQQGGFDLVLQLPERPVPPPIEPPPPPIEPPPPPIEPPPVTPPPGGGGDGDDLLDGVITTLRSNGIAMMLNRSYSISDRVVSGLAARRHLGLREVDTLFEPVSLAQAATDVPLGIRPERDLGPGVDWSAWIDAAYLDLRDRRYGLSTDGTARGLILGVDRQVRDGLVLGIAVGVDDAEVSGYGDTVETEYTGYFGGPYLGYRLDDDLVLDAWLAYGRYDADSRISILENSADFDRWFGSVNLTGQYVYRDYRLRPKLALFFAHDEADDSAYGVLSIPELEGYRLVVDDSGYDYGMVEGSLEVNRLWTLSDGLLVQPYGRAGVRYDFERPNDGELVTPDLETVTPSAWSGNLRLGVKALIDRQFIVDASGGYLSFGQNDLGVWQARLAVSWLF